LGVIGGLGGDEMAEWRTEKSGRTVRERKKGKEESDAEAADVEKEKGGGERMELGEA
jgi:hypothetical protein